MGVDSRGGDGAGRPFKTGDRVRHPTWGIGQVLEDERHAKVRAFFPDGAGKRSPGRWSERSVRIWAERGR